MYTRAVPKSATDNQNSSLLAGLIDADPVKKLKMIKLVPITDKVHDMKTTTA
jgi:hypothetical protein